MDNHGGWFALDGPLGNDIIDHVVAHQLRTLPTQALQANEKVVDGEGMGQQDGFDVCRLAGMKALFNIEAKVRKVLQPLVGQGPGVAGFAAWCTAKVVAVDTEAVVV